MLSERHRDITKAALPFTIVLTLSLILPQVMAFNPTVGMLVFMVLGAIAALPLATETCPAYE